MSILMTGGAGYVGSHVANLFNRQGKNVVVYDSLLTGFQQSLDVGISFIQGDILDNITLDKVVKENKIETVFHFAARLSPEESVLDPLSYFETNVLGTLNLLKACQKYGVQRLIFASSSTIYGEGVGSSLIEVGPKNPTNPYGKSKLFCENLIEQYAKNSGFTYKNLRYFNVAGAADNLTNGQKTKKAYHLIHLAAQAAVGKKDQIKIYGTDYETQDGTCIRDYIHVDDLADIHWLCYQDLIRNHNSDTINCGYGQGYSVKEILDVMMKLAPQKFKVVAAERRLGDVTALVADTTRLSKKFPDWTPKKRNLELICQSALEWESRL